MNLYRKVERFNLTRLGIIFVLLLVMTSIGYGKRQFLSVGTAPPGGAFFVVGNFGFCVQKNSRPHTHSPGLNKKQRVMSSVV